MGDAARADSGHLNRYSGKGWTPLSRRDNTPVVGGNRTPFDRYGE